MDEKTHLNHGVVLSNTARNFSGFVGNWCLSQLSNLGGDIAMPSITFSNDAGHAQRGWR